LLNSSIPFKEERHYEMVNSLIKDRVEINRGKKKKKKTREI